MIRIIVADDNVQSLWALQTMLAEQDGMEVVGAVDCAEELIDLTLATPVDVVLVDRMLPGMSLVSLMSDLHAVRPTCFVIVMGTQTEYSRSAMHAGADAFVSKSDDPEWLLERIRSYSGRWRK